MPPPLRSASPDEVAVPPVCITTASGVQIYGIQTGFVGIKTAHYQMRRPAPLRLLRILTDLNWTPLLPILTWLIVHPEGLILVDTGEVAAAADINRYMATDPANRFFYGRNLRLFVTEREELSAQLTALGIDPGAVGQVVMTHLHGDHAGGLRSFAHADVLIARAEYEGHQRLSMGAVRSQWPTGFAPRLVTHDGPPVGSFPGSFALTREGDVLLVPTPGHSYGHQSVLIRDGQRSYLIAGDLAFSEQQLRTRQLQGIAQDLNNAQQTLDRVWRYTQEQPTVFLPSHDPESLDRLARGQVVPGTEAMRAA